MDKRIIIFVTIAFMTFFGSCSASQDTLKMPVVQPTMYSPLSITEYFPLKQGAYWVYEGIVKWTQINSSDVVEENITWKMEVGRVFQRNNIVGYEMLGAPWDLAWYEDGKEPSSYGIIQAGGRFYQTPIESVLRLMNENDTLLGLVSEDRIFLDIPLIQGKIFCDTWSMTRSDSWYCWVVGQENLIDTTTIKGLDSSSAFIGYQVVNQTSPDHSIYYFIPGIGISRYVYVHHGTVSEVDVRLIEYYSGE